MWQNWVQIRNQRNSNCPITSFNIKGIMDFQKKIDPIYEFTNFSIKQQDKLYDFWQRHFVNIENIPLSIHTACRSLVWAIYIRIFISIWTVKSKDIRTRGETQLRKLHSTINCVINTHCQTVQFLRILYFPL